MTKIDHTLPVVHADDLPQCEDCGEPWCPTHEMHYADCPCPGPMSQPGDDTDGY